MFEGTWNIGFDTGSGGMLGEIMFWFRISAKLITRELLKDLRPWKLTAKDMERSEVFYLKYANNKNWWIFFHFDEFCRKCKSIQSSLCSYVKCLEENRTTQIESAGIFEASVTKKNVTILRRWFLCFKIQLWWMDLQHKNQRLFLGHVLRRTW
jgi:hypothetical protein